MVSENKKGDVNMSVLTITKNNFSSEVIQSDRTVLLDFWASWCGPCRMLSPLVDEIAEELPEIKVGKVNVDEEPELAQQFGVMSIPTLVVIKNGKVVNTSIGVRPKAQILEMLR
jgi:thioredoxin 1